MSRSAWRWLVLGVSLVHGFGLGCSSGANGEGEGEAGADSEVVADGDSPTISDGDDEGSNADVASQDASGDALGPRSGPLTLLGDRATAITDRVCDLDGDGVEDNVIADLGSPVAELFVSAINALLIGGVELNDRVLFHFPWVDDLWTPSDDDAVMITFDGVDTDEPEDLTDDFSGHEPFYAEADTLDACGEPQHFVEGVQIDEGALSVAEGVLPSWAADALQETGMTMEGRIGPAGRSAEFFFCAAIPANVLGTYQAEDIGGHTVLEVFVGGGARFGFAFVPGVNPDVDLDGDGLERFTLDEEGWLVGCVDGDHTEIPGADCYSDERIADAFSLNFRMGTTSARFAGREPGWEDEVDGTCESLPAVSLWDPPTASP